MKKTICILAVLLILAAFAGKAEFDSYANTVFDAGEILTADFDSDDILETMRFTCDLDEYDDGSFTLTVGQWSITVEDCICLERGVKAMKMGYDDFYWSTMFMVSELGPSDDPLTYCILYTSDGLYDVGCIPAMAEDFTVSRDGVITASVRANMIGTWYRTTDFILARGWDVTANEDDWIPLYRIVESPRTVYPMGMIVGLKVDLPLAASPYGGDAAVVLKAGGHVILAASDDVSRLYVTDAEGRTGGWLRMKHEDEPWADLVLVNGRYMDADDVFDGIFYAD